MSRVWLLSCLIAAACLPPKDLSGARCDPASGCGPGYSCVPQDTSFVCVAGDAGSVVVVDAGGTDGGSADAGSPMTCNGNHLVFGELTGDGFDDLVFADSATSTVTIWRAAQDTFLQLASFQSLPQFEHVVLADVVGSAALDLVLLSNDGSLPTVLRNEGDGGFANTAFPFAVSGLLREVAALDWNVDGTTELAVAIEAPTGSSFEVALYERPNKATFTTHRQLWASSDTGLKIRNITAARTNAGTHVLTLTNQGLRNIVIELDGGVHQTELGKSYLGVDSRLIHAVDFNRDGTPDLLVRPAAPFEVRVQVTSSPGIEERTLDASDGGLLALGTQVTDVCLGDFRLTPNAPVPNVVLTTATSIELLPSTGTTGRFGVTTGNFGAGADALVMFDFDHDGAIDLVSVKSGPTPGITQMRGAR